MSYIISSKHTKVVVEDLSPDGYGIIADENSLFLSFSRSNEKTTEEIPSLGEKNTRSTDGIITRTFQMSIQPEGYRDDDDKTFYDIKKFEDIIELTNISIKFKYYSDGKASLSNREDYLIGTLKLSDVVITSANVDFSAGSVSGALNISGKYSEIVPIDNV